VLFVFRESFAEIFNDVREDVETDDVEGTEGRAFWTAYGRPSHFIDFFDRVTVVEHGLDRIERAEGTDTIGDEVWTILCGDDAFAEALIEKAVKEAGDFGLGPFSANNFDEVQVTRRIEKVNT